MDGQGFDAIARQVGASRSRRGFLRAVVSVAAVAVVAGLARDSEEALARRTACAFSCGGERLQCRQECRKLTSAERHCKRGCEILRDQCHGRCGFTVRAKKRLLGEKQAERVVLGHERRGGRGGFAALRGGRP
jgi:hypothetical protein